MTRHSLASFLIFLALAQSSVVSLHAAVADPGQVLSLAASTGRFAVVCVWQGTDAKTQAFRTSFAAAAASAAAQAVAIEVDVDAPASAGIIQTLQLERAPFPLALVVAPNGAVTRGYHPDIPKEGFAPAFVGPGLSGCMKAMQEGKLAVVVLRNSVTSNGDAVQNIAETFTASERVKAFSSLVIADPALPADAELIDAFELTTPVAVATIALLVPPGRPIGVFPAPVTVDQLDSALAASMAAGCTINGCCP